MQSSPKLLALVRRHRVKGKQVHDANIVATMRANGLSASPRSTWRTSLGSKTRARSKRWSRNDPTEHLGPRGPTLDGRFLNHVVQNGARGLVPGAMPWSPQGWDQDSDQVWEQGSQA